MEKKLEELEIRETIETIQNSELLRTAKIVKIVMETGGNLLSLRLQLKLAKNVARNQLIIN